MSVTEDQVIEYLEGLNIIQLNDLVKKLEGKWDVKAASGGVVMAAAGGDAGGAAAAEPTEFDVVLTSYGAKKIQVIKELRSVISGLGLKEAKEIVDGVPSTLKEGITKEEADDVKEKLEAVGASVEIKPAG